jgi:hypothetical protein
MVPASPTKDRAWKRQADTLLSISSYLDKYVLELTFPGNMG